MSTQEQAMALRAAQGLAKREGWPADLLGEVEQAIASADPWGPDDWASAGRRWEAIADELADVATRRPDDAAKIARLVSIAQTGAGIEGKAAAVAAAPADFAQGVAGDVRAAVGAVPEVLQSGAQIARLALPLGLLAAGLYLWTRAR